MTPLFADTYNSLQCLPGAFSRVCAFLTAALGLVSASAQTPAPASPQQAPQAPGAIRRDVNLVDVLFTVFN